MCPKHLNPGLAIAKIKQLTEQVDKLGEPAPLPEMSGKKEKKGEARA